MGSGRGSSSKRKSSKKKISSDARRRKKTRRNKPKKLRRRDDSVSSHSDDDSRSPVAVSSSSSEDDYQGRRARSPRRSDAKRGKKRSRRSSSSRETSEDSWRVRKKKGSKRNRDSVKRKKIQKKRPRRDASISSKSSESLRCSTCQSSGSEAVEVERSTRGRSRENKKDNLDSTRPRTESKRRRKRSLSWSSPCRHSESSEKSLEEKLETENNSKRLRSIISIPNQSEEIEEKKYCQDEHKEEITYDHDDYPSSRSNDSNDGGSRRDLPHPSHAVSGKRNKGAHIAGRTPSVSNTATPACTEIGKHGAGEQDKKIIPPAGIGTDDPKMENVKEVSAANAGSDASDLESILRQKALENLKKFRGGIQTNSVHYPDQKNNDDGAVKSLSATKAEFVQVKPPNKDRSHVLGETQLANQSSTSTMRGDLSRRTMTGGKIPGANYGRESETAKQSFVRLPDKAAVSGHPEEKDHSNELLQPAATVPTVNKFVERFHGRLQPRIVEDKSESGGSKLRQESFGTASTLKQLTAAQADSKPNLLVTERIGNDNAADKTSQTIGKSGSNNDSKGVIEASGSDAIEPSIKPTTEEHSSKEKQDEPKDGSQFEHKTMSVMRGGELVQVSYKVKIPKRAPALARRQLKR